MSSMTTVAQRTHGPIVDLGGKFMTAPDMSEQETQLGLSERSLYFRGRSAVLGDPPPQVVTALFAIFPDWLVELMIADATPILSAAGAVDAYTRAAASWGERAFAEVHEPGGTATLLYRIADTADPSALPLFAGWRAQPRPADSPARLAHALMLVRELRGGLHFAALRSYGLGVRDAVVADPTGGRARLLRTGWTAEDADTLIARAEAQPDLVDRWQRAEQRTDETFGRMLAGALTETEAERLTLSLGALPDRENI